MPRIPSTGSADPVAQQNIPDPITSSQLPFTCDNCQRAFSSKTGLGVHLRRAHPDAFDQALNRTPVKARWSEEETRMLARKEAELTVLHNIRFMNQELARINSNRTLESIKGVRRKAEYKNLVQQFISELGNSPVPQQPSNSANSTTSNPDDEFITFLKSLPAPTTTSYRISRLMSIIEDAVNIGKGDTTGRLSTYIAEIFPTQPRTPRPARTSPLSTLSRRKLRRIEYAQTQTHWRKHQNRCIKTIIEGPMSATLPPREVMLPYWREVIESSDTSTPPNECLHQTLTDIWKPISADEVDEAKPDLSTSPGPDGISARQMRAIPNEIIVRLFNLILWCGALPLCLRESKTIFIPKKHNAAEPGDFRPITVPSIIVRTLHSILAKRIISRFEFDDRQRAFLQHDGCSDNTTLLDLLLRDHHQRCSSCYIASVDISKAFDSVSHNSIFGALESYNFPTGYIQYLKHLYGTSSTRLIGTDWQSNRMRPGRGVKQGDPLSPIIFNIIMDRLLRSLPNDVGCYIGNTKNNAIAFADDLILYASTPDGLQHLIDHTQLFLAQCGLSLNSSKCLTISIKGLAKQKHTVVEHRQFKAGNRSIPALKRTDEWNYLGITFTSDGRCKHKPHLNLQPKLDRLTKAPLKPQQRLYALRTVLIPQLYHKSSLGNVMIGTLNKTDKLIRTAVRKWLNLPADTPNAYFHAPTESGGLGIPALRWQAPYIRRTRLLNIKLPAIENSNTANTFIANEISVVERRLQSSNGPLLSKDDINKYWTNKLHTSIDGHGLREASDHKQAHRWIREPSKLLSGRDFINCVRLRINALPSKSRASRGRAAINRLCRAGCNAAETTDHILQKCHRTYRSRIDRHDCVSKFLQKNLRDKGYNTLEEPSFTTPSGVLKPDIIAIKNNKALVIDAQVVTDSWPLDRAQDIKLAKYNTVSFKRQLKEELAVRDVEVATATLNWRGIWSKKSVDKLLELDVVKKKDTALISTRVLIGGIRSFRIFNTTTSVSYRQGIG